MKKSIFSLMMLIMVTASCSGGGGLEGKYAVDGRIVFKLQNNKMSFTDEKGEVIKSPLELAFPYKVEGKNLVVYGPHADEKYEILPDGKLRSLTNGKIAVKK